jgi:hypothetical protein
MVLFSPIEQAVETRRIKMRTNNAAMVIFFISPFAMHSDNIKVIRQNVYVGEDGCEDDRNASWR